MLDKNAPVRKLNSIGLQKSIRPDNSSRELSFEQTDSTAAIQTLIVVLTPHNSSNHLQIRTY